MIPMKMFYGNTPVKSLNIKHYELNTNDCDMIASDLQAGKTAVAKGKKITGTGKSFEFAFYGNIDTNFATPIPNNINVIEIASTDNPIQLTTILSDMKNLDFSTENIVAKAVVDGIFYDIAVQVNQNKLNVICEKDISLEVFYGKDNYV